MDSLEKEVYANIWDTDRIARISPRTGQVLGYLDLSSLLPAGERTDPEVVLHGIAYDPKSNHLLVTGKLWPKLFEIELEPARKSIVPAKRLH